MSAPRSRGEPAKTRRGRPLKFGRPSRVVVLTLPEDILDSLRSVHPDPGWAVVSLIDRFHSPRRAPKTFTEPLPPAELVSLPGRRGLIVVQPRLLRKLPGVSLIPLPDGRAFLALAPLKGFADLEVAVIERLEGERLARRERKQLEAFRGQLRRWRRTRGLRFATRSIIVAEGFLRNHGAAGARRSGS